MKRAVWLLALMFLLMGTLAQAKLLGIDQYVGNYPDVKFDNDGRLIYNASEGLLMLYNSVDEKITLPSGQEYGLTDETRFTHVVGFGLAIQVDNDGNFVGGVDNYTYTWNLSNKVLELQDNGSLEEVTYTFNGTYTSDYDMVEVLLKGAILIGDKIYSADNGPVLLLAAEVSAFGWANTDSNSSQVDFLFENVAGALVEDGIWPTDVATGAFADIAGILDWTSDFDFENKGGDKFPTPEPATMLLVGAGLLGVGFVGRRRLKK